MPTTSREHVVVPRPAIRPATLLGVVVVLVLAGLALPAVLQLAPADAAARAISDDFDSRVLALTNVEREERGLAPLRHARCTDRFAKRHSAAMAREDRMYHQRLRPILERCKLRTVGENVAWRSTSMSAQQVVRMWMDSPGHRANILDARYRTLGVDAHRSSETGRVYAAQVFGR